MRNLALIFWAFLSVGLQGLAAAQVGEEWIGKSPVISRENSIFTAYGFPSSILELEEYNGIFSVVRHVEHYCGFSRYCNEYSFTLCSGQECQLFIISDDGAAVFALNVTSYKRKGGQKYCAAEQPSAELSCYPLRSKIPVPKTLPPEEANKLMAEAKRLSHTPPVGAARDSIEDCVARADSYAAFKSCHGW
jgi:hypothetical protein